MGRKQYNELNGGDKEGSYSNQGDFTQKFGLDQFKRWTYITTHKFIG